jgi:rhodanese-related sulfurtransferase
MNKEGYESIEKVMSRGAQAYTPEEFELSANQNHALILDTRNAQDFAKGFIPNAINIGLNGKFAPWVGALITDSNQPILFVSDKGNEEEVVTRLARVGYDNTIGYLKGGFESWKVSGKEVDTIASISAIEFEKKYTSEMTILDVRKEAEYESGHLETGNLKPLDYINEWTNDFDKDKEYFIHCGGGYRSMIAASILKSRGYTNLIDVAGGFDAIKATNLKVDESTKSCTN